ncbi:MAG: GWxTD domain-containing protein [Acidobacteria bacterium]|nr:GWxTD domain-containing protein [Acidobacteriota bacterium]
MRLGVLLGIIFSTISWGAEDYFTRWVEGPAKLVMEEDELDTFKKLQTPEAKLSFIRIFWARRDPNPETALNEFRQEFDRRVSYADQNFASGAIPGWQTPMGQIYVVFGPPLRTDRTIVGTRRAVLWWYGKLRLPNLDSNEAFAFVELHGDGRMYLVPPEPDPHSNVEVAQRQAELRTPSMFTIPFKYNLATDVMNERAVERPELTYDELLLTGKVTTEYQVKMISFSWGATFGNTVAGKRHVVVAVTVPLKEMAFAPDGEQAVKASMNLTFDVYDAKGERQFERAEEIVAKSSAGELNAIADKTHTHTVELDLPPGQYRILLTLEDLLAGRVGLVEQELAVPAE